MPPPFVMGFVSNGDNKTTQLHRAKWYCRSYEDPPDFDVKHIDDNIGEGLFATRPFLKGDFLIEYKGDLLTDIKKAYQLEKKYADDKLGCFMYFFKCKDRTMCVDATQDVFRLGRMINDAKKGDKLQNCQLKVVEVDNIPHLCCFAIRNIEKGEELRFDYGVPNLPWRQNCPKKSKGNVETNSEHRPDTLDGDCLTGNSGTPTCNTPKQLQKGLSNHSIVQTSREHSADASNENVITKDSGASTCSSSVHLQKKLSDHSIVQTTRERNADASNEDFITMVCGALTCSSPVHQHKGHSDHSNRRSGTTRRDDSSDNDTYISDSEDLTCSSPVYRFESLSGQSIVQTIRKRSTEASNEDCVTIDSGAPIYSSTVHLLKGLPYHSNVETNSEHNDALDDHDCLTGDSGTPTCSSPNQLRKGPSNHKAAKKIHVENSEGENGESSDTTVDDDFDSDYKPSDSDESDAEESDKDDDELKNDTNNDDINVKESIRRQMAHVTVPIYSVKEDGKRDYRKKNCCYYCKRVFTSKISTHYTNIHSNEEMVKSINLKQSPERTKAFLELENRGNFQHNVQVIEKGEGELIVARRPSIKSQGKYTADSFLPCEYCLAFYLKGSLWLHVNNCALKPAGKQPSANFVRNACVLLTPFLPSVADEDAHIAHLFNGMKETAANPGIPELCRNDILIKEFAKSMLCRLGEENEQRYKDIDNIRTKVRTVGRCLSALQNRSEQQLPLSHYITGQKFFQVVEATINISKESNSPQIALVLGHYIKHTALLKISLGIQSGQRDSSDDGRDFLELYKAHWNNRVSAVAKRRQKLRHINKPARIPMTEDLTSLKEWLCRELKQSLQNDKPSRQAWKRTAQLTIVRIVLFNKRRISEVSEMKVSDFLQIYRHDEIDSEIYKSLEVSERILSKRMKVVEVRGKSTRGIRKVHVILTPDVVEALDYLIRKRKSTSSYIFCRESEKTPLDGCLAMRDVTNECPGLREPKRIRTRTLRKYLATTSQILDMTEAELKMIADHMGHNLNVHTDVYRLQNSLLEKTKVARVLIAMENGQMSKFQGKRLDDISIDDVPEQTAYEDGWSNAQMTNADFDDDEDVADGNEATLNSHAGGDEDVADISIAPLISNTDDDRMQTHTNKLADDFSAQKSSKQNSDTAGMAKIKRIRWTDEENRLFREKLNVHIQNKTMPHGTIIKEVASKLPGRTEAQIRTKLHNIITGKLKKY